MKDQIITGVRFKNVPSFVSELNAVINVPKLGKITYDLAFGGAFYAFVRSKDIGLSCTPEYVSDLIENGRLIKQAIMNSREIVHPVEKDLGFLYGIIFTDDADVENVHSKHCCIFAEGEVDRSPTGTGVSARLAILQKKNQLQSGQNNVIQSIIGSSFSGSIIGQTTLNEIEAIVPEIKGSAYITGIHEFLIHPDDPLNKGFILR
jgi:trans-L-3-hydroxyproline dehydratase